MPHGSASTLPRLSQRMSNLLFVPSFFLFHSFPFYNPPLPFLFIPPSSTPSFILPPFSLPFAKAVSLTEVAFLLFILFLFFFCGNPFFPPFFSFKSPFVHSFPLFSFSVPLSAENRSFRPFLCLFLLSPLFPLFSPLFASLSFQPSFPFSLFFSILLLRWGREIPLLQSFTSFAGSFPLAFSPFLSFSPTHSPTHSLFLFSLSASFSFSFPLLLVLLLILLLVLIRSSPSSFRSEVSPLSSLPLRSLTFHGFPPVLAVLGFGFWLGFGHDALSMAHIAFGRSLPLGLYFLLFQSLPLLSALGACRGRAFTAVSAYAVSYTGT